MLRRRGLLVKFDYMHNFLKLKFLEGDFEMIFLMSILF